jgi:hypothetical protein
MLRGAVPPVNEQIGFQDINLAVLAYKRIGYAEGTPAPCKEPCP